MLPMIEEKQLQELLSDIRAYMDYLRREQGLYVSVHQIDQFMQAFMHEIKPYNYHECPYCVYMKSVPGVHDVCVWKQKALCGRIGPEPFFGTCWLGVGEYLFPLADRGGHVIGFVSVSGYAGDLGKTKAQTEKAVRRYGVDAEEMRAMLKTLMPERPSMASISALIKPLTYMFAFLNSYLEDLGAQFADVNPGQSALFDSVCSFLRRHFSTDYKLSEVAKVFAVSESSLSRLFSAYSNYTYRGYVNAIRINIGKVYLRNTDISVRELSELLGYSTPNYFEVVFQKACGLTPEKYRFACRGAS